MKVLFAIQGTGNGHLSRARDIIPHLEQYAEVDLLVSGTQVDINLEQEILYRKKGISFIFGKNGGIDYKKTLNGLSPVTFVNDILKLDLKPYQFIINDFEPVSAWAGKMKNKKVVALSHQAAFLSKNTPRYRLRNRFAENVLKYYAPSQEQYGFHFERYDDFIHTPIIRKEIRDLKPIRDSHYTVYLPAYDDKLLIKYLKQLKHTEWHVFSKHEHTGYNDDNVKVMPVNNTAYNKSVVACTGLLTGGGFEAPAEALYLGKKVMVIPMKGQYEQYCNAEAIKRMGVPVVYNIDKNFYAILKDWVAQHESIKVDFPDNVAQVVKELFAKQV